MTKEAEANRLKLTPEYLQLKFIESIANNSKIFFGDKVGKHVNWLVNFPFMHHYENINHEQFFVFWQVPNMIVDQRMLGTFLNGISKKDRSDT